MSRAGSILRVDLTEGRIEKEPTSKYARDYMGGGGIAAKLFWDSIPPEVSGLDPRNLLTFNTGPLTGTLLGTRCEVVAKSPLITNGPLVSAGLGGQFPAEMKFAGYDHIAITGKADGPVYLFINNDAVEIRDARHLWGLDTQETQKRIKEELRDPDIQIACIGPAGENLVVFSLILHDIQNAASQGGLGAVMGSKNLKAVAIRGTKGLKVANPEAFMAIWKEVWENYTKGKAAWVVKELNEVGLSWHYDLWEERNLLQWGYGPDALSTYPPHPVERDSKEDTLIGFTKKYSVGSIGCAFCPIQCQQNYDVPGIGSGGAACWTWINYRTNIKSFNVNLWWKALRKSNLYGLHTVEASNLIAWLMVLYEEGVITAEDTDGVPMEWASEEAVLTFIDKVSKGEGFGKNLANGVVHASNTLGKRNGLDYAPYERNYLLWAKYPEPYLMPGGLGAMQLVKTAAQFIWMQPPSDRHAGFQIAAERLGISMEKAEKLMEEHCADFAEKWTGNRRAWEPFVVVGKGKWFKAIESGVAVSDMTGHCDWRSDRVHHAGMKFNAPEAAAAVKASTGEAWTGEMVFNALGRKRLLEASYNLLCELKGEPTEFSEAYSRMWVEPFQSGYFQGQAFEYSEEVGAEYCAEWGCDPETGVPTRRELERLGMKDVIDELESEGLDLGSEEVEVIP